MIIFAHRFDQYMECLAAFTSMLALADRRPELYFIRPEGFLEFFIEELLREIQEHLSRLDSYEGDAITLHGSRSIAARSVHLVGMKDDEFAGLLVRTLKVERPSMLFGALRVFNTFQSLGLEEAGSVALRSAPNYTPSLAIVRSLRVVKYGPRDSLIDSQRTLYNAQLLCVKMWHITLKETTDQPRHAAQALRDGMIPWLGEFTKSRFLDKAAGMCPKDYSDYPCVSYASTS